MNRKWLFCETIDEAKAAQKEMGEKVLAEDVFQEPIKYIGGVDVSNTPFDPEERIFAAAIILSYPSLSLAETATQAHQQTFPYIPGLLGFREVPTLIQAYKQLSLVPDIIMVDGHGISHPRGLGIASHLGVLLDIPTIGVAKSILVGSPAGPLSEEVGSMVPLLWKGKQIAMMVRTKKRCSPLIVSIGHKVSLQTATQLVLRCLTKYRLPEPTRYAHLAANKCRTDFLIARHS
ncbi:MAG TPA: deoxyribonuclease V [Chlamydiales bacterium]|jgi:deoxyribonuclease V|nr:deoxyribonuclease V [Chlamydiales bacterium]